MSLTTPCIRWTGCFGGNNPYGIDSLDGVQTTAHRAAYCKAKRITLKSIKGLDVCHTCDHPWCVNLDHLFLGTRKQNVQDCISKGRNSRGKSHSIALARRDFKYDAEHARRTQLACPKKEKHPMAKLSMVQVKAIRSEYAKGGISQAALARKYGIQQPEVCRIWRNQLWREE